MREQNFSDERRGEMEGQSRGRGTVALYKQAQDCTLLLCYAQVSKVNVGSWTCFFFNNMVFEVGRNCPLSRAWSMRTGEFPILALTLGLSVVLSSAVLKKRTLENGRKYFFFICQCQCHSHRWSKVNDMQQVSHKISYGRRQSEELQQNLSSHNWEIRWIF